MTVLIAEDDAVSRAVLKRALEKLGHDCIAAEDGLEAWEAYQNRPDVEIIISDRMMPHMDGIELCKRVREREHNGRHTVFIFLTALGGEEHLLEGIRVGGDEYLIKPLDREQLRVKLVAASRTISLQRHMKAEGSAGGPGSGGDDGAPKTGPPALRRSLEPRVGGKAWDILVEQGKLTEQQLQQALEFQKDSPMELGRSLVELGFISDADLAQARAQRLNLGYAELTEADVDREAVELIPERLLRRHSALPMHKENGRLVVAMSDPTNVYALDDLRMICGCSIVPVVTTEENLQRMQARVFSTGDQVAEILEEAAEPENGGPS